MLSKQMSAQPELTRPLLTPSGLICTAGALHAGTVWATAVGASDAHNSVAHHDE